MRSVGRKRRFGCTGRSGARGHGTSSVSPTSPEAGSARRPRTSGCSRPRMAAQRGPPATVRRARSCNDGVTGREGLADDGPCGNPVQVTVVLQSARPQPGLLSNECHRRGSTVPPVPDPVRSVAELSVLVVTSQTGAADIESDFQILKVERDAPPAAVNETQPGIRRPIWRLPSDSDWRSTPPDVPHHRPSVRRMPHLCSSAP
jgi:hypothetical protein